MTERTTGRTRDSALVRRLCSWFGANARGLPWRTPGPSTRRDPYRTLVSEIMLQQTQVSRVVEKFEPFLARFPSVQALASAPEDAVLAEWTGLGYYRRARSLQAAARQVVDEHRGEIPRRVEPLLTLKGVGRYTAGAIASIAFDEPAPIVDGNVTRVVLRLEGRPLASDDKGAIALSWRRATDLVTVAGVSRAQGVSPGNLNESLMELGATVCTPSNPACDRCPVSDACRAHADGTQNDIPKPKTRAVKKPLYAATLLWRRDGRTAVEQRPASGLWAGLWQAPTIERDDRPPAADELAALADLPAVTPTARFGFATTHRAISFEVYTPAARAGTASPQPSTDRFHWKTQEQIASLALSSPQKRLLLAEPSLFEQVETGTSDGG
ncbi:MAG: A/G-specific adenine glycosylase [Planctomycetota bacterium]